MRLHPQAARGTTSASAGPGVKTSQFSFDLPPELIAQEPSRERAAARLLVLAAERQAAAFVLGLPVNMDGTEGPRAQSTRAFARNLARLTQLPIALWDERLSTAAVERELIAANVTRARRAKVIDQHAAVFILQGALDRLARGVMAH